MPGGFMGKPNLIYIFADQLRRSSVGYAGDAKAKTPNIDKLRSESIDICNAVSGHPVCAPYRASLFTGRYTPSTGMVINEIRLNPEHHPHCFANVLNDNGYECAYIGKWHMYAAQLGNHYDPKNSFVPVGPDRLGFDDYFAHFGFHHNFYGASAYYHLDTPEKHYTSGYEPDAHTDMSIKQIERLAAGNKPFAFFLSLGTPHDPWTHENIPGEYLDMFNDVEFNLPENYLSENDPYADNWGKLSERERRELKSWIRVYYAMTANLDYNIGRIMDALKKLGIYDNSIIVFTSDHGELFGAHGRRAKNIFYDEAVRVPFTLRLNGVLDKGTSDICFNTVDIMPTLLSLMDLPVPSEVEGYNFKDVLLGKPVADEPKGSLMMCTGATAIFEDGHEWRGLRTRQYTYAVYLVDKKEFLFDNNADPLQMKNLTSDPAFAEIRNDLKKQMYDRMDKINDPGNPVTATKTPISLRHTNSHGAKRYPNCSSVA
jgi:arylsulfatase A-like enzyme